MCSLVFRMDFFWLPKIIEITDIFHYLPPYFTFLPIMRSLSFSSSSPTMTKVRNFLRELLSKKRKSGFVNETKTPLKSSLSRKETLFPFEKVKPFSVVFALCLEAWVSYSQAFFSLKTWNIHSIHSFPLSCKFLQEENHCDQLCFLGHVQQRGPRILWGAG